MKSKLLFLFSLLALAFISPVFAQQENADAIVGVWETGNGKAHIYKLPNRASIFMVELFGCVIRLPSKANRR
jgi:hypothetical protein